MAGRAAFSGAGEFLGMVAENVVDGTPERVGEELKVGRRYVAAAQHHLDITHAMRDGGVVDAVVDFVGDGEYLEFHVPRPL
jgi:aconitase A